MSTLQEKLDCIYYSVEAAKKRRAELDIKQKNKTMTRAELFELDMTVKCIQDGEKILKENRYVRKENVLS